MATTLTAPASTSDDLVHVSFPITKFEKVDPNDPNSDLYVYGKATDGSVDSDEQIVDSDFSGKAIQNWLSSGANVRVQHNSQRDPAGIGVEATSDNDGATWVKSLVVEPVAKTLVSKGALRAYSVGIARPKIVRDSVARGGRIVDGEIVEISLVDRPANKNCGIQLVKAATLGGAPEWVGKTWDDREDESDTVNVDVPKNASISFSPADLAKLMTVKKSLEADVVKKDVDPSVGGGVDRDKIPAEDFAGRDRSFPIVTPGDVSDAASSIGRAGSDNYSSDQLKANIKRIAHRKGPSFVAELPESWKDEAKKSADEPDDTEDVSDTNDEKLSHSMQEKGKKPAFEGAAPPFDGVDSDGDGQDADKPGSKKPKGKKTDTDAEAKPDTTKGAKQCANCGKNFHADSKLKRCSGCNAKLPKANKSAKPITINLENQRIVSDADLASLVEKMIAGFTKTAPVTPVAEPVVEKKDKVMCPACGANQSAKHGFCSECGKSMAKAKPVNKNHDFTCVKCNKDLDKGEKFCPGCGKKNPGYLPEADRKIKGADASVEKGKPTPADGASGAGAAGIKPVPAHREPDGPDIEDLEHDMHIPTDPDGPYEMEMKSAQRIKTIGAPYELGALHDLTCPCFHPDAATKSHPSVTLNTMEIGYWQQLAENAIYGGTFEEARKTAGLLHAAQTVQGSDPNGYFGAALRAHKAFQDANSSVSGFPSPSTISPTSYNRPYITDGHAKPGTDYDAPNAPGKVPASGGIHADDFDRGYVQAGHAAQSPSNTKSVGDAMTLLHDHLAETYPGLCSMATKGKMPPKDDMDDTDAEKNAGDGGDDMPMMNGKKPKKGKKNKGAKGKNPMSGDSQENDAQSDASDDDDMDADKAATPVIEKAATLDVEILKSVVVEATGGLLEKLTEVEKALKAERKKNEKLAEQVDGMMNMADPRINAYRATSLMSPTSANKSASPAGWTTVAETAERTQAALMDVLLNDARTNESSAVREAAWDEIYRMNGIGGH